MNSIAKCRSCHAEIVWMVTDKGKNCPADLSSITEEDKEQLAKREKPLFRYGKHVCHFRTCPDAKRWRGR